MDVNIFELKGKKKKSKIILGELFENILHYTDDRELFIITDVNVSKLYSDKFPDAKVFVIGIGETVKTFETVNAIYAQLVNINFDRQGCILGIGGGIVCDITGFVASTYMRGLSFGLIPTTLLAQVDASIGGKNGYNFCNYKNMIGTFNQPDFVLSDFMFLKTLELDELKNGIAETIKHSLIGDSKLYELLLKQSDEILSYDLAILKDLITKSVKVKLDIVDRDELEKDERKKLNFGHTLGHAVELYEGISHGNAVSIGMAFSSAVSLQYGYIKKSVYEGIIKLIDLYKLPTGTKTSTRQLIKNMTKDKKRQNDGVDFILLKGVGQAFIKNINYNNLESLLDDLR